jgi:hypothetical protein
MLSSTSRRMLSIWPILSPAGLEQGFHAFVQLLKRNKSR